jgi:hypothetical protein
VRHAWPGSAGAACPARRAVVASPSAT